MLSDLKTTAISRNAELIADNLLSANTNAFIDNMNYTNFAKDLVKIYEQRFGTGRFI